MKTLPVAALAAAALLAVLAGPALLSRVREAMAADPLGGGVRVLRDGTEVELSGPLAAAMLAPLQAALTAGARTVQLDSPGGLPGTARSLAAAIGAAHADTAVTDRCLSACVPVWLAGQRRWLGPFAQLGLEATFDGIDLLPLYRERGLPAAFLPAVAETPSGQAWFPTPPDMLQSGMGTAAAGPDQFALAGFGPAPTAASVRARLLGVPAYRAVADADPAGFDADIAAWTEAVLNGQPGTAAFARTRQRLDALSAAALRSAPESLLAEHARLFAAELTWMAAHDAAGCPAYAAAQGRLPGPKDPGLVQRRADLQATLLATPATAASSSPDPQPLLALWDAAGLPDGPALLDPAHVTPDCMILAQAWILATQIPGGPRLLASSGR